ncbi:Adaptive-response sensory-kinase SasA [Roseobacter fucihabitans]|uniref:histidine kinase n=1 Tax=Roseobacter fucihabitans TaxID=1537242 RepID=A0ABZ2BP87_9RHOB|nr:PAS domain-containing sensor histidine kinase [Roseobacter litoralis]MBC6967003.1 Phytochrome-like protein cph1 [Roseobacter litoralis]
MQVVQAQYIQQTPALVDESSLAFWSRMSELVPGIIYIFNHETMCNEYSNCTIAEFLGYTPEEVLAMGDAVLPTLVHHDDHERLFNYLGSLRSLPIGAESAFEYRMNSKLGNEVWMRSVDTVFETAPDGSVLRHIGVAVDITSQKRNENRLLEANETLEAQVRARTAELQALNEELETRVAQRTAELVETNRDLKQLTFVATHDLRVPVNNMTSLTHMLLEAEEALPPEHAETLTWMHDVCRQANDKLDALICVAQAHSAELSEFEAIDIANVADRVLVNLHFQVAQSKSVIRFDLEVKTVWFVPRELENILQSMIGNAIKYRAAERRPRIILRSRVYDNEVEVSIIDNGTGLDLARDEAKVFGLFKRAHATPEGAGVSLYAIRRILERIGGSIAVASEPGKGSCFSFRLPIGAGGT